MSNDQSVNTEVPAGTEGPTEKQILMERARTMNITFSNNITVEKLREKIEAKMAGDPEPEEKVAEAISALHTAAVAPVPAPAPQFDQTAAVEALKAQVAAAPVAPAPVEPEPAAKPDLRTYMKEKCLKLVRLRITNLDPKKKDLKGEILTVANEYIGTVRKFIPYGEVTDGGYHVPNILYEELKSRRFQNIRVTKARNGQEMVESNWALEFALEVLPPLTEKELKDLAIAQLASGSVDG